MSERLEAELEAELDRADKDVAGLVDDLRRQEREIEQLREENARLRRQLKWAVGRFRRVLDMLSGMPRAKVLDGIPEWLREQEGENNG